MAEHKAEHKVVDLDGRLDGIHLLVSSPNRVVFPELGVTKWDLVQYYLSVRDAVLRGVMSRATVLHRFPKGIESEPFFQKRVPDSAPGWLSTTMVTFPNGGVARELCPTHIGHLLWAVNLGSIDVHPWATKRWDPMLPDELRIDLDPDASLDFGAVREVAHIVRGELAAHGIQAFPKTSGKRGLHLYVRLVSNYDFDSVRLAALAVGRRCAEVAPDLVTTEWEKERRGQRVFIDFNQNCQDRTIAAAYCVRPTPNATVSMPITWEELDTVTPQQFTIFNAADRLADVGDVGADLDDVAYRIDSLLELASEQFSNGYRDAPWPPHFPNAT